MEVVDDWCGGVGGGRGGDVVGVMLMMVVVKPTEYRLQRAFVDVPYVSV